MTTPTTPGRQRPATTVPDANFCTPARSRQGDSNAANFGDTEIARDAIARDTGPSIPEVQLALFLKHVWPQLPIAVEKSLTTIVDLLKGKGIQETSDSKPAYANGRWTAFPKDPAQSVERENPVFVALVEIAQAISAAVAAIPAAESPFTMDQTCEFSNTPDNVPSSTWRDCASRPDGYFIRTRRQQPEMTTPHWMDIALTGEYKKCSKIEDINDVCAFVHAI